MPKPVISYPVKPMHINQGFGANEAYYKQNFGTNGHMGIDFQAFHGQPVYATHDGEAIYVKDAHGGEGIWLYGDGFATIYWHLIGDTEPTYAIPIPFDNGYHAVKKGDLIGYADNTGAPFESSGDHCHFGMVLVDAMKRVLNQDNGFNGCIDPTPYFDGTYAQDTPRDLGYIASLLAAAKAMLKAKLGR